MLSGKELISTIESLEPELTNPDKNIQKSGLEKLTENLSLISCNSLNQDEVETLLLFFINKLDDHHSFTRVLLQGIFTLVQISSLTDQQTTHLVLNLLSKVQTQSLPQVDRNTVYNILTNLVFSYSKALKSMGYDFVFPFIQTIDGEKDPRNLVLTFRLSIWVMQNFEIERFAEDLFEVVSCYFPIDFTPPSNDVYKISREQLIDLNLSCMAGSPLFADFCQPLILEKLTADLASSRESSLLALGKCASVFEIKDLCRYQGSYIDCFYREYHRQDKETYKSLVLNSALALAEAYALRGSKEDVESLTDVIFKKFATDIFSRDHKVAHKSSNFISGLFSVGHPFSTSLADKCLTFIVKNFSIEEENRPHCYALQIVLSTLNERSITSSGHKELDLVIVPLGSAFKSRLHCFIVQLRDQPNLLNELLALNVLSRLLFFPSIIPVTEQSAILELLIERCLCLIPDSGGDREEWTSVLSVPSHLWRLDCPNSYAAHLRLQLIHMVGVFMSLHSTSNSVLHLLTQIKKSLIDENEIVLKRELYWQVLDCCVCHCPVEEFGREQFVWLVENLLSLVAKDVDYYLCQIFHHYLLKQLSNSESSSSVSILRNCLLERWNSLVSSSSQLSQRAATCLGDVFLLLTVLTPSNNIQENLVRKCFESVKQSSKESSLSEVNVSIGLSASVILGLNTELSVNMNEEILNSLFAILEQLVSCDSFDSDVMLIRLCRSYGFVVFKSSTDASPDVDAVLEKHINSTILRLSSNSSNPLPDTIWLLSLLHFLLLSKRAAHSRLLTLVLDRVLDSLVTERCGPHMSTYLSLITTPPTEDVTIQGHVIFPNLGVMSDSLFAQKCFYCVAGRLRTVIDQDGGEQRDILLGGYLKLVDKMPEEIICDEASNILSLILPYILTHGTKSNTSSTSFSLSLQLLTKLSAFPASRSTLEEYFSDLIQLLVDIIDSPADRHSSDYLANKFEIRYSVCNLLVQLSNLPAHTIARHRQSIIKALKRLTDDRKRLIRKQAVHAINLWS